MSRKGYNNRYEKEFFIPANTNKTSMFIIQQDSANGKITKNQSKKKKNKK